jgi:hypothetical protein
MLPRGATYVTSAILPIRNVDLTSLPIAHIVLILKAELFLRTTGDRIELGLDLPVRLEPIDAEHPNTVAVVRGPLVLFAVEGTSASVSRQQLLAAERRPGEAAWRVTTSSGAMLFRSFSAINDEPYRTYMDVD